VDRMPFEGTPVRDPRRPSQGLPWPHPARGGRLRVGRVPLRGGGHGRAPRGQGADPVRSPLGPRLPSDWCDCLHAISLKMPFKRDQQSSGARRARSDRQARQ
jgi:hypothetical protein